MTNGDTPGNELAAWIERLAQRTGGADPALSKALQRMAHVLLREREGATPSGVELDSATKAWLKARLTELLSALQRALDQRPALASQIAHPDELLAAELARLGAPELLLALQQNVEHHGLAEVPASALHALCERYAQLYRAYAPARPRIAMCARELAAGDETLRESLERVAVEACLDSGDRDLRRGAPPRAVDLEPLLLTAFPKLRDAYLASRKQVRSFASELTDHNPDLTRALIRAGEAIIVRTHAAWLEKSRLRASFSIELNSALRNHFAHLPVVQEDFLTLSLVCDDITRKRVQQFKSQAVHADDCRQIALAELAKLRIRHASHPYTSFRAAYSGAAHHALVRARKESARNEAYPIEGRALESPPDTSTDTEAGRAFSLSLIELADAMVETFWPVKTRAKLRRAIASCFITWWRMHRDCEQGDSGFPVGEELITRLVAELEDAQDHADPRNRVNGILTQMRQDVESWLRGACAAAGCEEVAPPLCAIALTLIAPYTHAKGPGLSPGVLPVLRNARPKLAAARATPPWLLGLTDWLIAVLEGGLR